MNAKCAALIVLLICLCAASPGRAATGLTWRDCEIQHPAMLASIAARCTTLRVPLDRTHPRDAGITLAIAVAPALNRRAAAAPLFLLAGGPGQAATAMYASFAGAFARIKRDHDIVLVDQRGTGASAPLQCHYPDDFDQAGDSIAAIRIATVQCLDKLGARVRFFTTAAAVEDLNEVRAALGYARIDLYAASYGTRVAQSYMRKYPGNVHAVILDGVTDPERPIGPDTPLDADRTLKLIVSRCLHSPDCAQAFPHLDDELAALRRKFGPAQLRVRTTDPTSGKPLELDFGREMFNAALRFLSYSALEASLLPVLLHQAAAGNLSPLAAQAILFSRQVGDQLASGMQNSVVCSEDVPYFDAAHLDRNSLAPSYQGTDQIDGLIEICKTWPRGPVDGDLHSALHSEIPTLLLSGEADPVTPPAAAARAAKYLTHHRHLVLPGEGHGQLATACVPRLMSEFLDHAQPEALDAGCLAQHRPPAFFVNMTGPAP